MKCILGHSIYCLVIPVILAHDSKYLKNVKQHRNAYLFHKYLTTQIKSTNWPYCKVSKTSPFKKATEFLNFFDIKKKAR